MNQIDDVLGFAPARPMQVIGQILVEMGVVTEDQVRGPWRSNVARRRYEAVLVELLLFGPGYLDSPGDSVGDEGSEPRRDGNSGDVIAKIDA